MHRETINTNEIAINEGTSFDFVAGSTRFKLNADFSITVSLTYKINDPASNLQIGSRQDEPIKEGFDSCGILKKATAGIRNTTVQSLKLATDDVTGNVSLASPGDDIDILTDGEKGNHGNSLLNKKKKKK